MPYLFQLSLGPVQSFIKGARRTRDLKFNSSFLCQLATCAATKIMDEDPRAELIFPASEALRLGDVSNKVLACIFCSPDILASKVKDAIDNQVKKTWQEVVERVGVPFHSAQAWQQVYDLVEYVYAALEFDAAEMEYDATRRLLEALVTARKNTRDFLQVGEWSQASSQADFRQGRNWGSVAPKSSIDGLLESVIPEEDYPRLRHGIEKLPLEQQEKLRAAYEQKIRALRNHYDAGPHEKLSGVDLLKRRGSIFESEQERSESQEAEREAPAGTGDQARSREAFPSTSHMAALPFLCALNTLKDDKRQEAEKWKTEYLNKLEDLQDRVPFALDILPKRYREHNYWDKIFSLGSYDGALLFPERFPDIVGDTENFQEAKKAFQQASAILEAFCRKVGLYPNPYYVLLAADGDFMGRVIDAQAKVSAGMKRHQQLSQALATFSTGVRKIVKAHAGVRIYSGGDDVLALLPLHEAVQCARVLAESFRTLLRPFQSEQGSSPTLSVGLAVVHHLHPLGDALEIARQAEGRAKKYPGKNALAITVHKRGGPPCEIGGHWDVFEARLEAQIGLYQQDIIPTGMAYELDEIAQRLEPDPEQAGNSSVSPPYVQYAALRVFQRKLDEAKRAGHSEKEVEATLKLLKEMIGLEQLQPVRVGTLADELVVARLFADARRLARGQGKGELA